jgi:hypothetical protein
LALLSTQLSSAASGTTAHLVRRDPVRAVAVDRHRDAARAIQREQRRHEQRGRSATQALPLQLHPLLFDHFDVYGPIVGDAERSAASFSSFFSFQQKVLSFSR